MEIGFCAQNRYILYGLCMDLYANLPPQIFNSGSCALKGSAEKQGILVVEENQKCSADPEGHKRIKSILVFLMRYYSLIEFFRPDVPRSLVGGPY